MGKKISKKNIITYLLILLLLPLLSGCGKPGNVETLINKGKSVNEYTYESLATLPDGSKVTLKTWVENDKIRTEMGQQGWGKHHADPSHMGNNKMKHGKMGQHFMSDEMVMITHMDSDKAYMYLPNYNQVMVMPIKQSEIDTTLPQDYLEELDPTAMTFIDKATVNGHKCWMYEYKTEDTHGNIWLSQKNGLPLRVEMENDEGQKETIDFLNLKVEAVDDTMFEIPEEIQIIDLN